MAHHDDLIALARQLIDRNKTAPVEAELRRAVSTAYYALFHLLTHEGTARLVAAASIRHRVARTFGHTTMKAVCDRYVRPPQSGQAPPPAELVRIADTFVNLLQARHQADYDLAVQVTHPQAEANVVRVEQAFQDWGKVQSDPASDAFLADLWCEGMKSR